MTGKVRAPKAWVAHGVKYNCECGFSTMAYWGKGSIAQAAFELSQHKRDHAEGHIKPEDWRQWGVA